MKKIAHITFICLAVLFTLKNIAFQLISLEKQAVCYEVDMNENESQEENKKGDAKEKEISEEGEPAHSSIIRSLNAVSREEFPTRDHINHYTPYLEICSPPPELI